MEIGMIGLGKMGANMARRLREGGHRVVGYDVVPAAVDAVEADGIEGARSVEELVGALAGPRTLWMMVPAGDPVDETIEALRPHLDEDDLLVDGGNSHYKDSIRRHEALAADGIWFVDCGVSGGIWGRTEGYCLMAGGEERPIARLEPALRTLAPGPERGWGHVGPIGAGHFVKMVHNGIEYGLMEAYGEGFAVLAARDDMGFDLHQVAEIWRHGSVIRSWLLDLAARALDADPALSSIRPWVPDSGEGRWTVFEAIDLDVSVPVIAASLFARLKSRDEVSFAERMVAALRHEFGGHPVERVDGDGG